MIINASVANTGLAKYDAIRPDNEVRAFARPPDTNSLVMHVLCPLTAKCKNQPLF